MSKDNRLLFIEMVLSCADENLPLDSSVILSELLYRTDDIEERLECLDEQLENIERKLNTILKILYTKSQ
jgi:chaperonin cofactor prefoldin